MRQDDAIIKVDGKEMKGSGKERSFETPPIEVGKKFRYTVSAFWEPNNYTKITRDAQGHRRGRQDRRRWT